MNNKGFTLVELLAVLIVMIVLAFIAIPAVTDSINNAKISTARSDTLTFIKAVNLAQEEYQADNNGEPAKEFDKLNLDIDYNKYDVNYIKFNDDGSINKIKVVINSIYCIYRNKNANCSSDSFGKWYYIDSNSNGVKDKGDLIGVGTEKFYIMSNDGTNVRAVAMYNLLVGETYTSSTGHSPVTGTNVGLQDESAIGWKESGYPYVGVVPFSQDNYWYNSKLKTEYGTSYPAYVFDDKASINTYIEDYKTKLKAMNSGNLSISLMSYNDLRNLGCDFSERVCSEVSAWINSTSYWTGSAYGDTDLWIANSNGYLYNSRYGNEDKYGIRPVVKIPFEYIEDAPDYDLIGYWDHYDRNNDGLINVGDTITLNQEEFYIISNDGVKIRALAKYNLLVGETYTDSSTHNSITESSGVRQDYSAIGWKESGYPRVGVTQFSRTNYWHDDTLNEEYGTSYPAYVFDDKAEIKKYLVNYQVLLKELGCENISVSLITQKELTDLGCNAISHNCLDESVESWVYSTTYWTGSAYNFSDLWTVWANGDFINKHYSVNDSLGIRPVIEIPLSYEFEKNIHHVLG